MSVRSGEPAVDLPLWAIHLWHPHGGGVRHTWTHADGGEVISMWTSPQKLEPTDVILSSSHLKKFATFVQNFVYGRNKRWTFIVNMN